MPYKRKTSNKKKSDIIPSIWDKADMKKGYLTDELAQDIFNFIPGAKPTPQSGTGLEVRKISPSGVHTKLPSKFK